MDNVQDKTATARITAIYETDYFRLAKLDVKCYIKNVLPKLPKPYLLQGKVAGRGY